MKRSIKLIVSGNVQGVGFREYIKKNAEHLGLQGTVQNVTDGTVVIYVSGQDEQLEELIDAVYRGTPKTTVDRVAIESFTTHKDFRGVFRVIGEEN